MGNREALLVAAKKCLLETGYDRTTWSAVAESAKVSKAAIGYHFGSLTALLQQALVSALRDFGEEYDRVVADTGGDFEALWTGLIDSFTAQPQLWRTNIELFLLAQRTGELRELLARAQGDARPGMVALMRGVDEAEVDAETAGSLGAVHMALIMGISAQWLTNPQTAPNAAQIAHGLRELATMSAKDS